MNIMYRNKSDNIHIHLSDKQPNSLGDSIDANIFNLARTHVIVNRFPTMTYGPDSRSLYL
jgi:hypothetical protein